MVQKNCLVFRPVIIIGGATATGKSELAIELAKKFGGEIISADSMQIYKGFDIGTAKTSQNEMQNIPHYLLSYKSGTSYYSVAEFKKDAENKIDEILKKGKLPIVVGGTGLYLNSILFNYQFGGKGKYEKGKPNYNFLSFVLELPREKLYKKIDNRVDNMIDSGLIDEIKGLLKSGFSFDSIPFRAIGYKEFKDYFNGSESLQNAVEKLKKNSRHYAKRQITWFKQWDGFAHKIEEGQKDKAKAIVEEFLKNGNKN